MIANVKYNPCPSGPSGVHVYGLDLSWRAQYVALGFSKLGGWLSPLVGNLTQLKMLSLANNRLVFNWCMHVDVVSTNVMVRHAARQDWGVDPR